MLSFFAIVIAVIALVVAQRARSEAAALRRLIAPPPPPPPTQSAPEPRATPATRSWNIDWENLVGIKLFGWIAGIALVLAAVFLFKYSVDHGWLRPAVRAALGLVSGIAIVVVCELRIARNYRFTANAMHGAGIAILYATLFALHEQWHLWPAAAVFVGMVIVTAAAVYLSTRRDSVFIALLGLLGGFATPVLLSSGENHPLALFSYLLLLNGGMAWIAWRKQWPLLTALSVALTAFYQWSWVHRFLTTGQLPLAAAIFIVFAAVAAFAFVPGEAAARQTVFRRIGAAGAVLPLLFAFFTAVVPEYGAQTNVLFGFLFLVCAGLGAIAIRRGPEWLHTLGGAATLLTFFVWLAVSYTSASWPWPLVWVAAFVALYGGQAILPVETRSGSSLTLGTGRIACPPPLAAWTAPLLFFVFVGLAIRDPDHALAITGAMAALLAIVVVVMPRSAAIVNAFAFATVYLLRHELAIDPFIGVVPLAQAALLFFLRAPHAAVLFLTLAIYVQLEKQWITIAWAAEGAALAWLRRREWLYWSGALAVAALMRLAMTPRFDAYLYTYLLCAIAAFASLPLRRFGAAIGTIELFMLLNVAIMESRFAQDLTYTIAWAVFALTMLVVGIVLHDRAARIAALALLLVTILKCFLHDLASLEGLSRVASLFGLAVSLVLVGLMLEKFVRMKRPQAPSA